MEKIYGAFHHLVEARIQEALPFNLLTYVVSRLRIAVEAYRNTADGIPLSFRSSSSSACSPALLPNSGFASTSVLSAITSLFYSPSALSSSKPFPEITGGNCTLPSPHLSTLTEWSQQHIRAIFEAESDEDAVQAIQTTFADKVSASVNGAPLPREGIDALVLSMRKGSNASGVNGTTKALQVQWKYGVDVPRDPFTNRDGSFGGVYVIKGIKRMVPGLPDPVEFERHKTVTVKIDSMSADPSVDSRRITNLVFVASDVRTDTQAIS